MYGWKKASRNRFDDDHPEESASLGLNYNSSNANFQQDMNLEQDPLLTEGYMWQVRDTLYSPDSGVRLLDVFEEQECYRGDPAIPPLRERKLSHTFQKFRVHFLIYFKVYLFQNLFNGST